MFLVLLAVILPIAQPGLSSSSNSAEMLTTAAGIVSESLGELVLTGVCPGRPVEYVIITNKGPATSLLNMSIEDGEGKVRITEDIVLDRYSSLGITMNKTIFNDLWPDVKCLQKGDDSLTWSGRFILADDGDDVRLQRSETLLDKVIYGDMESGGEGWTGPPIGNVPKAHALVRTGGDSDTSSDWSVEPPGRSSFPALRSEAIVEPFSAPENALERILRELALASRTVNISLYELSDPLIVDGLTACAHRGVSVNVLIEGQPVGGISDPSLNASATLIAHGVNVQQLRSNDSYKRYDYLHSKYMVVDSRRVLVTSENWGHGLHGNRGWGVVMDGREVGRYYNTVFENDILGKFDIVPAPTGGSVLSTGTAVTKECSDLERYRCAVTALVAPDNAGEWLKRAIDNATDAILVEQLSVDEDWLEGPTLVGSLISAASRGVKVCLLMDSSWGGRDNPAVAMELNRIATIFGLDLEARMISPYHGLSVMHNKGLIIDDQVVVSSLNWGDTSMYQNREVGTAISSPEVATYFRSLFWQDWALDPILPTIALPWTYRQVTAGDPILLDATACTDNAPGLSIEWDVGGDGSCEGNGTTWAVRLPPGNHTIVLTVTDLGNNSRTAICWVEVMPHAPVIGLVPSFPVLSIPLVAVMLMIGWKTIIGRKGYR